LFSSSAMFTGSLLDKMLLTDKWSLQLSVESDFAICKFGDNSAGTYGSAPLTQA
jgi:hypothetical protein